MNRIRGVTIPLPDGAWFGPGAGTWTPTDEILRAAEPVVLECIRRADPGLYARLDEYFCQFLGRVTDGRREVYCNFFHREVAEDDWRTRPVTVLDGGEDYFHVVYDVATGRCVEFYVHGEA